VGTSKRLSAVRWGVAQSMVMAWVLTLLAAGLVAALSYELLMLMGLGR
jgi:PiT family inorganic phosphate transporter